MHCVWSKSLHRPRAATAPTTPAAQAPKSYTQVSPVAGLTTWPAARAPPKPDAGGDARCGHSESNSPAQCAHGPHKLVDRTRVSVQLQWGLSGGVAAVSHDSPGGAWWLGPAVRTSVFDRSPAVGGGSGCGVDLHRRSGDSRYNSSHRKDHACGVCFLRRRPPSLLHWLGTRLRWRRQPLRWMRTRMRLPLHPPQRWQPERRQSHLARRPWQPAELSRWCHSRGPVAGGGSAQVRVPCAPCTERTPRTGGTRRTAARRGTRCSSIKVTASFQLHWRLAVMKVQHMNAPAYRRLWHPLLGIGAADRRVQASGHVVRAGDALRSADVLGRRAGRAGL